MFLEQPCLFRTKEDLEVLKSCVNKTVCMACSSLDSMAGTIAGALFYISVLACTSSPFLCLPSGVGGTL